jgi:hypothetical protein
MRSRAEILDDLAQVYATAALDGLFRSGADSVSPSSAVASRLPHNRKAQAPDLCPDQRFDHLVGRYRDKPVEP